MKIVKKMVLTGVVLSSLGACNTGDKATNNKMIEMHEGNKMECASGDSHSTSCDKHNQNKMGMEHSVSLKKGELMAVISSKTKDGADEKMKVYFEKVFPVASKHGFKPLASFPIDKVVEGNYRPNNFVGLYSWPNMNAVQGFLKELPQDELTEMRLEIWEELKQIAVMIEEDVTFTFEENKVYEIRSLTTSRSLEDITENGGRVVFDFKVAAYEDLKGAQQPTVVSFIEWDSEKKANAYTTQKMMTDGEVFFTHLELKK